VCAKTLDWVLLRDATRTLMKAITLIRAQGLRHRMEDPAVFIRCMNILAMGMTHIWSKKGGRWKSFNLT
jgi:hypothetical protein